MSRFSISNPTRFIGAGAVGLALAAGALVMPAASFAASPAGEVVATGTCSHGGVADISAQPGRKVIEVDFDVEHVANQSWKISVVDNGHTVFRGSRTTLAATDAFALKLIIPNRPGVDTIVARATNTVTGEVCRATVRA